jgi:general stress protein YciG
MEIKSMAKQAGAHGSGGKAKSAAGQKGVSQKQVGAGKERDPNNFANDPERASAAGRKGGKSHGKH